MENFVSGNYNVNLKSFELPFKLPELKKQTFDFTESDPFSFCKITTSFNITLKCYPNMTFEQKLIFIKNIR